MQKYSIRNLSVDEIEARIGQVKANGLSLLLYKNARVDMSILDELFGPFGWKRTHQLINGNLFCTVSVKDPKTGEWIDKQDVGTESRTEATKGEASDSFKRAAVNWGIGRELYSAPFIWVPASKCKIEGGKCYDRFRVSEIGYTDGKITSLAIVNDSTGKEVYRMGQRAGSETTNAKPTTTARAAAEAPAQTGHAGGTNVPPKPTARPMPENVPAPARQEPAASAGGLTAGQLAAIRSVCKNHGMPEEKVFALYHKKSLEELTPADWEKWKTDGKAFIDLWDKTHPAA